MRHDFQVFVPQEGQSASVSYSMYVYGIKKPCPVKQTIDKFWSFNLDGNCIAVLFYYFSGFERAYVVTGWDDESSECKSILPGVEGSLYVLFTAVGRDFRLLKKVTGYFTRYSDEMVFRLPFSFWFRVCALIQMRKARSSNLLHLLHLTKEECEFNGRQNDLCAEVSV